MIFNLYNINRPLHKKLTTRGSGIKSFLFNSIVCILSFLFQTLIPRSFAAMKLACYGKQCPQPDLLTAMRRCKTK